MSLLPTSRINSLVSSSVNNIGAAESGLAGQDEDILLVDFQPVIVPNSQILSSPSTTTSTAMYPIPPPGGAMPGAHLVGLNHHPSISSDGITTPLSAATGSSGKTHNNPNNYSLVSLSNHVHHHSNNKSRYESDLNYHPHHPPHHHRPSPLGTTTAVGNAATAVAIPPPNIPYVDDDENDEFARHQALAQLSYMLNKRRSRRFNNRDNHMWDNTNHVGLHLQQPQGHMSSSLSSSEDSDTGFLMGTRKTAYTRRSVQRVVDPHPAATVGGNASPSATTGLLPTAGNRKRVRRRRPSARNRKPVNNQRDKIPNPSDVLSFCCCLCEDDQSAHSNNHRSQNSNTLRNRYFRLICVVIIIIVVAVLASITVSLQRKVDSLDWNLKKLDEAVGSPLATDSTSGASNQVTKPSESLETLIAAHNTLNATVVSFKGQLEQAVAKLQELQKQLSAAATKQDVTEVRDDLAKLGSRVEDLASTIDGVRSNVDKLNSEKNQATVKSVTRPPSSPDERKHN